MGNIELTLESHINSITQSNMFGIKMSDDATAATVKRISKNLYYRYSTDLGKIAVSIWNDFKDRKNCHAVLLVAFDLEMEWREKNQLRTLVKILQNHLAYDSVPFAVLINLKVPTEVELRNSLMSLSEEVYRNTKYFQSVRLEVLRHFGFECQNIIKKGGVTENIQCGSTKDLDILYLPGEHIRGLEHRNYRNIFKVMCERCRSNLINEI